LTIVSFISSLISLDYSAISMKYKNIIRVHVFEKTFKLCKFILWRRGAAEKYKPYF
jgi:hypothetical protein